MPRPPSSTFASIALLLAALPARAAEPQPAVTGTAVSTAGHRAAAPDLAVGPRGEIALLWVDRSPQQAPPGGAVDRHVARTDVYVAISRDGGASFAAPAKANAASGAVWGQPVSRPRVAGTRDGAWHVAWAANDVHPGLGKAVLTTHYSRSGDGGRSFAPPRSARWPSAPTTRCTCCGSTRAT